MGCEVRSFEDLDAFTNSLAQSPVCSGLIIVRVDVEGEVMSWRLHDEVQVAVEEVLEKHRGEV